MDPNLPEYGPQPQQPQNPFAASEPGSPAATNVQMMEMLGQMVHQSQEQVRTLGHQTQEQLRVLGRTLEVVRD